ncbi:hypothetical protein IGI04_019270 [Brassica rapa subsp. trilocularis]|uniref:Uncharacterized protein n=1 Tax=Brassica rapa subsp. trilocularis TaxID=1813537 RepID=A0ABQ7MFC4_BRACM|nr:hypothetical protein IGI04_019270 [Brassica rapa subsp. trilocularis]
MIRSGLWPVCYAPTSTLSISLELLGTLNQVLGRFSIQDRTWTMVRENHREDSGHGKMCGEWVIVDRCEVLIAYCATCELMLD